MGIPHLKSTLEPYGQVGTIRGERVVIDGPAFAYHITGVLQGNGTPDPTAKQIAQTAVKWVTTLSSQGTVM